MAVFNIGEVGSNVAVRILNDTNKDPVSKLNELAQYFIFSVKYDEFIEHSDNDSRFTVNCLFQDYISRGVGKNKRECKYNAAISMVHILQSNCSTVFKNDPRSATPDVTNPVELLYIRAHKHGFTPRHEFFEENGQFTCCAQLANTKARASAASKKLAKRECFKQLLDQWETIEKDIEEIKHRMNSQNETPD